MSKVSQNFKRRAVWAALSAADDNPLPDAVVSHIQACLKKVATEISKKARESLWDKFLRGVRGPNSDKYRALLQRHKKEQDRAEIAAGEMAGELRHSLSESGAYEKGISKIVKKWQVNPKWVRQQFLESGSLGDVVYDLPKPQTVRKSLAKKMMEAIQKNEPGTLQEAMAVVVPMMTKSRIKNKPSFDKVFRQAESLKDLMRGLYYLDLAYSVGRAEPALSASEEVDGIEVTPPHESVQPVIEDSYGEEIADYDVPLEALDGGRGDDRAPNEFDREQVQRGIRVELEHTDDKEMAAELAVDHLVEDPKYYDHLQEMEAEHTTD